MDKLSESEVSIFSHHISLKDKKHKGERANSLLVWHVLQMFKDKKNKNILALISRGQVLRFAVNKC